MELTLAKALIEKNRLTKKISEIKEDIRTYNSQILGAEREVDVEVKWGVLLELTDLLIDLKFRIAACNLGNPTYSSGGIQRDIFRLSELKSLTSFLRGLNTQHGPSDGRGYLSRGEALEYCAIFRKSDVDEKVEVFEKEINDIQQKLNQYNYETTFDFDTKGLI